MRKIIGLVLLYAGLTACGKEKIEITATPLLWVKVFDDPEGCTGHYVTSEVRIRCENAPAIVTYADRVRVALDPQRHDASCTIKQAGWNTQVTLVLPSNLNRVSDKFSRFAYKRRLDIGPGVCEGVPTTEGLEVLRLAFGLEQPANSKEDK